MMKGFLFFVCLALLFACNHKTPVEPEMQPQVPQWAMFGKNLRNTSNAADPVVYYSGPKEGRIVWTFSFGPRELCYTSPSLASDGTIYLATLGVSIADSGFIYAVNPDGTLKWRFVSEKGLGGAQGMGAVGSDDTYFILSNDKYFYALAPDGEVKWQKNFSFNFSVLRPAVSANGEVIVPVQSGVIAFEESTGDTAWFHPTATKAIWGVTIDREGNIYTGTETGLLSLSPKGTQRWEFPVPAIPILEPVIAHDGTILFTVTDSLLYALYPDGRLKWTFNLKGSYSNVPGLLSDGRIVTLNSSERRQKLFLLQPDGELLWEREMKTLVGRDGVFLTDSQPIIDAEGNIYLAIGRTFQNNFYVISASGDIKWGLTIDRADVLIFPKPAIGPDGTLYVAGDLTLNAIR